MLIKTERKEDNMKKLVEVVSVENEGLLSLLGKNVTFFCMNYIYTGELIGVQEDCVLIKNPAIVYETGSFTEKTYKDVQSLCVNEFYIAKNSIESFGVLK